MINKKIYLTFKELYNKVSKKTILDTLSLTGIEYNTLVDKYNKETVPTQAKIKIRAVPAIY